MQLIRHNAERFLGLPKERGMSSPWIGGLRSVALDVPDLARLNASTPRSGTSRSQHAKTMRSTYAAPAAITIFWRCMPAEISRSCVR